MKNATYLLASILFFSACSSSRNLKEPEFREISEVRFTGTDWLKTTASADMVFYNPNNSRMQLTAARGKVYINNTYFGSFVLDNEVNVSKRAEFIIPLTIKIDNINAVRKHRDVLKKKDALVRIEGLAFVKKSGISREIPIRFEQQQDLDQLRAMVSR